jgi:hypothetical protein
VNVDFAQRRQAKPGNEVRQKTGHNGNHRQREAVKKTIALFLRPGSRWDKSKSVREQAYWNEHARFVDDLFDRGLIMLAGPFVPEGSGALVILNVDSVEEARAIYANDPWAHQDILLTADTKEWTIFLDARENLAKE